MADDKLVATLKKMLNKKPGEGLTTHDFADALGISKDRTSTLLQEVHRQGRLVCDWVPRPARDGRLRSTPTYRLKLGK